MVSASGSGGAAAVNVGNATQGPNGSLATADVLNGAAPSTGQPGSGGAAAVNVGNATQGPNGSVATIDVANGAGPATTGPGGGPGGPGGGTGVGGGAGNSGGPAKTGGALYDSVNAADLAEALGPECTRVLKDPQHYSRRLWRHCHWLADRFAKRHHQAAK